MKSPAVRIRGSGAVTPYGAGVQSLWQGIEEGRPAVSPFSGFENEGLPQLVVGKVPDAVDRLQAFNGLGRDGNRAAFLAGIAIEEALRTANLSPGDLEGPGVALFLSTTKGPISAVERFCLHRKRSGDECMVTPSDLAGLLARTLNISGTVQAVSSACASGAVAIALAADHLSSGRCDRALVVGVDILSAFIVTGFLALKALSSKPARPFDVDRDGLNPGEASAAIILDVTDENSGPFVKGWGLSNDAHHITGPDRHGSGLAHAIRAALNDADTTPDRIGALVAHGTGTVFNDAMEMRAIEAVFSPTIPPVCGIKGAVGHSFGAAGLVEAALAVEMLRRRKVPNTLGHGRCEEEGFRFRGAPLEQDRILSSNSGFGGVNAAVVIGKDDSWPL
ncbi:MAG: beta-ketoacyl-[acyl-carrier-protein] synthase family protein [Deltaproteobacteria bacterium]|nr:beta-ketoacyl-[acyl-carrier-protein] synthase family protein [Deltaproteobacteria bacterium]